jgi:hypothetical protein
MDALCSLYAVINGLRLACDPIKPVTVNRSRELFAEGVKFLHRKNGLSEAVTDGMYTRRRLALAQSLAALASTSERVCRIERADPAMKSMDEVFNWITSSIFDGQPVLIPLMGGLDHLSVVSAVSSKLLFLFDSSGLAHVRKSSCGRNRHHQIPVNALMRISVT